MGKEIDFKELTQTDLTTTSNIHELFSHWKKSSVQRKLAETLKGKDKRFIALEAGRIVGHVRVLFGKGLHKHRAEITSLVIEEHHRRHHIGLGLMKHVLGALPATTSVVLLAVDAKNKPAISLYKKLGFKKYGLLKNASQVQGKFVDNYLMSKERH